MQHKNNEIEHEAVSLFDRKEKPCICFAHGNFSESIRGQKGLFVLYTTVVPVLLSYSQ